MPVRPIPEGYHTVTPHLLAENVDKVINFLKSAFGAQEKFAMRMPDGNVMHAEMQIGDSMLMLGPAMGEFRPTPCMLFIYTEDADKLYQTAVKAGATPKEQMRDQFWGDRAGSVQDPFGNHWWIATHKEDVSMDELLRRAQTAMQQHA